MHNIHQQKLLHHKYLHGLENNLEASYGQLFSVGLVVSKQAVTMVTNKS